MHSGEFDLHAHHKAIFELCNCSGESIHANTTKATFGCSGTYTEIHKTYFCNLEFFMKPKTNYKYMDTWMLIELTMFQIED
jgi:hypothetical protein